MEDAELALLSEPELLALELPELVLELFEPVLELLEPVLSELVLLALAELPAADELVLPLLVELSVPVSTLSNTTSIPADSAPTRRYLVMD